MEQIMSGYMCLISLTLLHTHIDTLNSLTHQHTDSYMPPLIHQIIKSPKQILEKQSRSL